MQEDVKEPSIVPRDGYNAERMLDILQIDSLSPSSHGLLNLNTIPH